MIAFAKIRKRFKGLLDKYTVAAAAFSLRPLSRASLLDPVVKVRRSSDNATQNFPANQITDGSLLAFVGGGDGFVEIWYDQSGNGRDAVQTTLGNQPLIVKSGVLQKGIRFEGTQRLVSSNFTNSGVSDIGVMFNIKLNSVVSGTGTGDRKVIFRHLDPIWTMGSIWFNASYFRPHYLDSLPNGGTYRDYSYNFNDLNWHSLVYSYDESTNAANMWTNNTVESSFNPNSYNASSSTSDTFIIGDESPSGSAYGIDAQINTLVIMEKTFTQEDSDEFNEKIQVN